MSAGVTGGRLDRLARGPAAWAAVIGVALALRLAFVFTAPPTIAWPDGRANEQAGWLLASEHRYTADFYLAPAYPVLIGAVYSVTGRNLFALRLVEAALATGTVVLIGVFGVALFSPAAGWLAAALAALHPVMAYLPIAHYAENLLLLQTVLAFGMLAFALRRPSVVRWLGAGALYGIALLGKPTLFTLLPGLAAGAFLQLRRHGWARMMRWGATFAAALALVILPWIVRNHQVHGRWFLITVGGGRVFWMGNNPAYTGGTTYFPVVPDSMRAVIARLPQPAQQENLYYEAGRRFIREHPGRAAWLYLLRVRNLWALFPRTHTRVPYSTSVTDWAQGTCSLAIFAGALLGLGRIASAGLVAFPLGILSYTLMISCYYTVLRYRMSVEVLLLWLAGVGWAALLERRRR